MSRVVLLDFDGTITSGDTTNIPFIQLPNLRPWRVFLAAWFVFKMVFSTSSVIKQKKRNNAIGYLIRALIKFDMNRTLRQFSRKIRPFIEL